MKKRFLLLLLICISILAIGTVSVSAETTEDGIYYSVNDDEITITGCDETITDLVIPAEIDGIPVTKIGGDAFSDHDAMTSVTIPDSVTSIGFSAFNSCDSLTSVTLGAGLKSVGSSAFYSSIREVYISNLSAYLNCTYDGYGSNPVCYAERLYLNGEALTGNLTIPDDVTQIPSYAFYDCDEITGVTIPGSVTSIGISAFYSCDSLTSITIPEGVTSIGAYAFCNCEGLLSVSLPASVTSIGGYAFAGDMGGKMNIIKVSIADLTAYLNCTYEDSGSNPMNCAKRLYLNGKLVKGEFEIPAGVTKIPDCSFCRQDITGVKIPDSVTAIGGVPLKIAMSSQSSRSRTA